MTRHPFVGYVSTITIMKTKKARIFQKARSQTVSLPKEFRFEPDTVRVRREGQAVVPEPAFEWPERWVESFTGIPDDFIRPAQGEVDRPARNVTQ
jgi:antitoxin VapB